MKEHSNKKRHPLESGFTIGFIGGGQLARMSALQASRFGMNVAVYATSSTPEPVENMTPLVFRGRLDDEDALTEFARSCDLITLENEFLDSRMLARISQASGTAIYPAPESFHLIEDKLIEKRTFQMAGIPVTPFKLVKSEADIIQFGDMYGWPFLLKSSKGGYDGYGNATVKDLTEGIKALEKLGHNGERDVLAEAFVPFTMELAVMVARNKTGIVVYPCVESIQKNHICKEVIAPARIPPALQRQAQELAVAATEAINGIGIFGFEFFLTHDNRILLNESAPRPHNSGHYTIEACITSQFENHVRAVCGLPLGSPDLKVPAAVMINILGSSNGPAVVNAPEKVFKTQDAHLHIYGKLESRKGRKMAHLTLLGKDSDKTLESARSLAKQISI